MDRLRMLHKDEVSLYPKAGLLKQGISLYNIHDLGISERDWCDITPKNVQVCMKVHVDPIERDYMFRVLKIFTRSSSISDKLIALYVSPLFKEVFPMVHVRRIQRAIRGYLTRKFEGRAYGIDDGSTSTSQRVDPSTI